MLNLKRVTKTYGEQTALQSLSLDVREGELFGLLGPNGAGKSTTVHLSAGLIQPDEGSIDIGGLGSPSHAQVRRQIGVAPQTLALYEELSARENLQFFARMEGLSGRELKEGVAWALEFVGLSGRRNSLVSTFSGGMKRRLNLAVAVVHRPALLLLDEPTVGVDPQSRNAIFERIEALRESGKTIVYTTHYMEEAQRLCDRIGILDQGRLLALGTVPELLQEYGGNRTLVVETEAGQLRLESRDPLEALNRLGQSHTLRSFRLEGPDLEAVFLNLTGRALRD